MSFRILQIAVPFIWFGFISAISFLETPLKFKEPNITLPLGLGIGRIVFTALNKVEMVLAVLMLLSFVFVEPQNKFILISFGAIALLLLLETFWLLPTLNARAAQIIAVNSAPPSNARFFYIAFEVTKTILLFALGISIIKSYLKFE